jgi:hypothetical protein
MTILYILLQNKEQQRLGFFPYIAVLDTEFHRCVYAMVCLVNGYKVGSLTKHSESVLPVSVNISNLLPIDTCPILVLNLCVIS